MLIQSGNGFIFQKTETNKTKQKLHITLKIKSSKSYEQGLKNIFNSNDAIILRHNTTQKGEEKPDS